MAHFCVRILKIKSIYREFSYSIWSVGSLWCGKLSLWVFESKDCIKDLQDHSTFIVWAQWNLFNNVSCHNWFPKTYYFQMYISCFVFQDSEFLLGLHDLKILLKTKTWRTTFPLKAKSWAWELKGMTIFLEKEEHIIKKATPLQPYTMRRGKRKRKRKCVLLVLLFL